VQGSGVYGETSGVFASGISGVSPQGYGVYGRSQSRTGVQGECDAGTGVSGRSVSDIGVSGFCDQGTGVYGETRGVWASGVRGQALDGYGVYGKSESRTGVQGESDASIGISGKSVSGYGAVNISDSGIGTYSESTSNVGVAGYSKNSTGVHGVSDKSRSGGAWSDATGVKGFNAEGWGVLGQSTTGTGVGGTGAIGVEGWGTDAGVFGASNTGYGVHGRTTAEAAVWGHSIALGVGVLGQAIRPGSGWTAQGVGVVGASVGVIGTYTFVNPQIDAGVEGQGWLRGVGGAAHSPEGIGVLGDSAGRWAGYFNQDVCVLGTLVKGSSTFRIDHPLEPEEKYLNHCAVESPQMKTFYDGVVVTDESGFAEIEMPRYFAALNQYPLYQLTVLGQFAQAIVERELNNGRFTIRTDKPRVRVSWQVTATRKDAYALTNPVTVEEEKPASERGLYLHPIALGRSAELSAAKRPALSIDSDKARSTNFDRLSSVVNVARVPPLPHLTSQWEFANPRIQKSEPSDHKLD
jgi:hypothetical protein